MCQVVVGSGPWVVGELGAGSVPVAGAELVEIHVQRPRPIVGVGLGCPRHLDQFGFECPTARIERPGAVGHVHVRRVGPVLGPQTYCGPPLGMGLEKRVRQDVAGAGREEPLIGPIPRELLIGAFQWSPPEDRAWNVHPASVLRGTATFRAKAP